MPDTIPGDRCIVTTHKPSEHHVAFVKDRDDQWWLLDSKGPKREPLTPQAYLERMRIAGNDTVGIVFQQESK